MQYHAPTDQFTISAADMKRASSTLRYALKKAIREVKAQPTYAADEYYQDLRSRLETSYDILDTAPIEEVAA